MKKIGNKKIIKCQNTCTCIWQWIIVCELGTTCIYTLHLMGQWQSKQVDNRKTSHIQKIFFFVLVRDHISGPYTISSIVFFDDTIYEFSLENRTRNFINIKIISTLSVFIKQHFEYNLPTQHINFLILNKILGGSFSKIISVSDSNGFYSEKDIKIKVN